MHKMQGLYKGMPMGCDRMKKSKMTNEKLKNNVAADPWSVIKVES